MRACRPTIRELTGDDGAAVDAVFAGLSTHSRLLRYHSPLSRLTTPARAALLDVDGRDRLGLVAELPSPTGWGAVGMARLVRTGPDEAEIAVEVVDSWQRRGVGLRLLTELGARARRSGTRCCTLSCCRRTETPSGCCSGRFRVRSHAGTTG